MVVWFRVLMQNNLEEVVCNGSDMEGEVCDGGGIGEGVCDGGGMENGKQRKGGGNGDQVRFLKFIIFCRQVIFLEVQSFLKSSYYQLVIKYFI